MAARNVRQRVILQVYLLLSTVSALCLAYSRAALFAALSLGSPGMAFASITPETFKVRRVAVTADMEEAKREH